MAEAKTTFYFQIRRYFIFLAPYVYSIHFLAKKIKVPRICL
jgi:hypothetical protein